MFNNMEYSFSKLYKRNTITLVTLVITEFLLLISLLAIRFVNLNISLFYFVISLNILLLIIILFFLLKILKSTLTTINKFNKLILLIENLNKNIPFTEILKYIFNSFSEFIPYTHIGVALVDDNKKIIRAAYGISSDYHKNLPAKLIGYQTSIKTTSLGEIIRTGKYRVINDLEDYLKGKKINEYNKILLQEGIRSSITFPLKNNDDVIGIIFFSSNTKNIYTKTHIDFLNTLANSITLSIEEDILMDDMIISSVLSLAKLTEERDPETGDHIERMKKYCIFLAELLSKNEKYRDIVNFQYIKNIERFSPLHDIGKVAISDDILLKPGKLTKEEFEVMKTHASYGAKTLSMSEEVLNKRGRSVFSMGIEITGSHHEKWNGSGYPNGLRGDAIPLSARIVAIADVFDALTSKRPYKEPFSFDESINIITKESGVHFDPDIVKVFIDNKESLKELYLKLNVES